jgi:hypothetical protein
MGGVLAGGQGREELLGLCVGLCVTHKSKHTLFQW